MSTINIHNYESYFLDYSENALSEAEKAELISFLNAHPELNEEFELITSNLNFTFVPENITFENKERLQNIAELSLFDVTETEYLCIGAHEGDLSAEQTSKLEKILSRDAQGRLLYEQIKQARIKPDTKIKFPKHRIKRTTTLRIKPLIAYAAAASVMLFFGIRFSNSSEITTNDISQQYLSHTVRNVNFTKSQQIAQTAKFNSVTSGKISAQKNQNTETTTIEEVTEVHAYEPTENAPIAYVSLVGESDIKFGKFQVSTPDSKQSYSATLQRKFNEMKNPETLWAIAETGVSVLGKMTDSDIQMKNSYTENGKLQEFNFSGENIKLRRTFNSNKH